MDTEHPLDVRFKIGLTTTAGRVVGNGLQAAALAVACFEAMREPATG